MTMSEAAIRKAAILIDSLDNNTADSILSQMGSNLADRVRQAVLDLGLIDAEEQSSVIHEFFQVGTPSSHKSSLVLNTETDELNLSFIENSDYDTLEDDLSSTISDSCLNTAVSAASKGSLNYLNQVDCATLTLLLSHEHPQTIAVVAAQLQPSLSAELLASLSSTLQFEVLQRLSTIDDTPIEVLQEVETSFQQVLKNNLLTPPDNLVSNPSIRAIFQAAKNHTSNLDLVNLTSQYQQSLQQTLYLNYQRSTAAPIPAEASSSATNELNSNVVEATGDSQNIDATQLPTIDSQAALAQFRELRNLTDLQLRQIFAYVDDSEILSLGLFGSCPQFVNRVLKLLPKTISCELRASIQQIQTVQLLDIEYAQIQIGLIAHSQLELNAAL